MTNAWPKPAELRAVARLLARTAPLTIDAPALRDAGSAAAFARGRSADAVLQRQRWLAIHRWRSRARDASLVTFWDPLYPPLLREIARPPVVLFVRGDVRAATNRVVAIVGARAASSLSQAWTRDLAADLARCGITVASGMARGIDAAAHRGAIAVGGRTLAVLGSGPDECYPPEHAELAEEIVAHGCCMTEFWPGTPPAAWHFPRRNRILAGLAAGVVVVQAEPKSGALVTARFALDENRVVMAVPGDVVDPRSTGPHRLLRDGAALIADASDVLEALGWSTTPAGTTPPGPSDRPTNGDAPDAEHVLAAVGSGASVEAIVQRLGWSAGRVQSALVFLELAGLVERDPAGRVLPTRRRRASDR